VPDGPFAGQVPPQDIFENVSSKVSNVNEIVDGGAARIHPNRLIVLRFEIFLLSSEGIRES
jgi:hypothetical protein